MSSAAISSELPASSWGEAVQTDPESLRDNGTHALAASITKAASRQTFHTIRLLVDRPRVDDAYRAYAYFRWLDDWLDRPGISKRDQQMFVVRQQSLVARCYEGESIKDINPEENMLVELISADHEPQSGLRAYIQNMMAVMAFDANRRGKTVSGAELNGYSLSLAAAVTEALHYFIGHDSPAPQARTRYLAAMGAHIVHMLRDAAEDTALGYFNIPGEYLEKHRLGPDDFESAAYRQWVRQRVEIAKSCFRAGKDYLSNVPDTRCRLAAFAYMARFNKVLRVIEQDDYRLRPVYQDRTGWPAMLRVGGSALALALRPSRSA